MNLSLLAQYTCYPGEIDIFNPVNSTANSVSYYTGTPNVCVNRSSLPICNVSLDRSDISTICLYSTGLISKFYLRIINSFLSLI